MLCPFSIDLVPVKIETGECLYENSDIIERFKMPGIRFFTFCITKNSLSELVCQKDLCTLLCCILDIVWDFWSGGVCDKSRTFKVTNGLEKLSKVHETGESFSYALRKSIETVIRSRIFWHICKN